MSLQIYDKTTGNLTVVAASATRTWIGSKAAHDAEALANTLPNNCLLAVLATGLYYRDASGVESLVTAGGDSDVQVITMPTADVDHLGKVVQYIGTTTVDYTHGYFYECVSDGAGGYEWTDLQVQSGGATIQYTTLPTASISELGRVVQYIGTTTQDNTHGYFYECVFDGTDYKWVNIPVQNESEGQTIQVDTLPTAEAAVEGTIYQYVGTTTQDYINGFFYKCVNDNGTYKWENIPVQVDENDKIQYETMPTAEAGNLNKIVQYVGTTTQDYTKGYFYICSFDGTNYTWERINVQDTGDSMQVTILPTPDATNIGKVLQYIGSDTATLEHGHFYECVFNDPNYEWVEIGVSDGDNIQMSVMPTASKTLEGRVFQYIGSTDENFIHNYFYQCVGSSDPSNNLITLTDSSTTIFGNLTVTVDSTAGTVTFDGIATTDPTAVATVALTSGVSIPAGTKIVGNINENNNAITLEVKGLTCSVPNTWYDVTNNKEYEVDSGGNLDFALWALQGVKFDNVVVKPVAYKVSDITYSWVNVDVQDGGKVDIATPSKVGVVKPDDLTIFINSEGTIRTKVWAGTLAEYSQIKNVISPDTTIIIVDADTIPTDYIVVNGIKIVPWATGTDAELAAMLAGHDAGKINIYDYWKVGDERVVQLAATSASTSFPNGTSAQTVTHVLANVGYYNSPDVKFVVMQKNCLLEPGYIKANMSSTTLYNWNTSDIRTFLNTDYRNALPSTYRTLFKQVPVITATQEQDFTPSSVVLTTTQDYFALFAESEVAPVSDVWLSPQIEANQLRQMDYFNTNTFIEIPYGYQSSTKKIGDDGSHPTTGYLFWALRSIGGFSRGFCVTITEGYNTHWYDVAGNNWIAPFGCI